MYNETQFKQCPVCRGKGNICVGTEIVEEPCFTVKTYYEICWACNGAGKILENEHICDKCLGDGIIYVENEKAFKPSIFHLENRAHSVKCVNCNGRGVK